MEEGERGLSTASLTLLFLLAVVVCAVFFSFGFLLGYRERSASKSVDAERVTPTGNTPPMVNPPPEKATIGMRHDATPIPGSSATQPPAADSGQKGERGFSRDDASARYVGSGVAPGATQGAASASGSQDSPEAGVPAPATKSATEEIVLQVAALQTRQDAEALLKVLKERGYRVFLVTPEDARANDNLFRVRVGPFPSRDEEEKTRLKLVTEGFKPFVKR